MIFIKLNKKLGLILSICAFSSIPVHAERLILNQEEPRVPEVINFNLEDLLELNGENITLNLEESINIELKNTEVKKGGEVDLLHLLESTEDELNLKSRVFFEKFDVPTEVVAGKLRYKYAGEYDVKLGIIDNPNKSDVKIYKSNIESPYIPIIDIKKNLFKVGDKINHIDWINLNCAKTSNILLEEGEENYFEDEGEYYIVVKLEDGEGRTTSKIFDIVVEGSNPEVSEVPEVSSNDDIQVKTHSLEKILENTLIERTKVFEPNYEETSFGLGYGNLYNELTGYRVTIAMINKDHIQDIKDFKLIVKEED